MIGSIGAAGLFTGIAPAGASAPKPAANIATPGKNAVAPGLPHASGFSGAQSVPLAISPSDFAEAFATVQAAPSATGGAHENAASSYTRATLLTSNRLNLTA